MDAPSDPSAAGAYSFLTLVTFPVGLCIGIVVGLLIWVYWPKGALHQRLLTQRHELDVERRASLFTPELRAIIEQHERESAAYPTLLEMMRTGQLSTLSMQQLFQIFRNSTTVNHHKLKEICHTIFLEVNWDVRTRLLSYFDARGYQPSLHNLLALCTSENEQHFEVLAYYLMYMYPDESTAKEALAKIDLIQSKNTPERIQAPLNIT
jgi:hypothetical protein